MAKLDNFSGLTRPQEDLLKKHYCFGSLALLNLNLGKDNFTFHTRISEKAGGHQRASAWLQFKNDLFLIKGKRRNDQFAHYKLEVTPGKLLPNAKAVFECQIHDYNDVDGTATFEYNHEQFRGKASLLTSSQVLRLQGTFGKPQLGFGFDNKFSIESVSITNHVLAFWYFKNDARLVLKHAGKTFNNFGQFTASYLHAVSSRANIGSLVTADWATRGTYLEVGGDFQYDDKTWVKGKLNSEGSVGLALTRLVANNLRLSVATDLTAASLLSSHGDPFGFGIRIDFSD